MTMETIDRLGDLLIEKGLVPSRYVLDLNHGFTVPVSFELPAPWNLPSRLFRFPIEVSEPIAGEGRRIGILHPLLAEHPFVRHVMEILGIELNPNGAPNAHGVSKSATAMWWHAVDFVTAGNWRELIETRRFTTDADIARAVAYGLNYSPAEAEKGRGYLTLKEARSLLSVIGSVEPCHRPRLLRTFATPSVCKPDGREHWPINEGRAMLATDAAWGRIIGLECGWFKHDRAGFLQWTAHGRDLHFADEQATFTETATGQGAFNF